MLILIFKCKLYLNNYKVTLFLIFFFSALSDPLPRDWVFIQPPIGVSYLGREQFYFSIFYFQIVPGTCDMD